MYREAPDGAIDPNLKTLSFWDGDTPLLALHAYATHPMSYYGRGGVSADFVGLARRLRQQDDAAVMQIYASGCSGDVTAGKYNDGAPATAPCWPSACTLPCGRPGPRRCAARSRSLAYRVVPLELPFRDGAAYERKSLLTTLRNPQAADRDRILAAMALSSRDRLERGQAIDLPCLEITPVGPAGRAGPGTAQQGAPTAADNPAAPQAACLLLFPGESFVGYQLLAQRLRPEAFVLSIGYGECWPGYIPTEAEFDDGFTDMWLWVSRGCEPRIRAALEKVLAPK